MPTPHEALEQLLSAAQAETLNAAGADAWHNAASALQSIVGQSPAVSELTARLAMPGELTDEFADDHLVAPIELSTARDQNARAYLVIPGPGAARFFDSSAADPAEQEQQTIVMASTIAGQVLQTINATTFASSPAGIAFSLDDIVANTMPDALASIDEPCLALNLSLQGSRMLPLALVLPGTFLDIVAGAYSPPGSASGSGSQDTLDFTLTEEELEQAELIEDTHQATEAAAAAATSTAESERDPTPIGAAPTARRAQFGPLPEAPAPRPSSNLDLLADLHMEVSVELGRTTMAVADVLALGTGSIVELDRLAGEPVDILVNDRVVARGEVVVVDENFGIRIVEVLPRPRDVGKAS